MARAMGEENVIFFAGNDECLWGFSAFLHEFHEDFGGGVCEVEGFDEVEAADDLGVEVQKMNARGK